MYTLAHQAHRDGSPIIRPLFHDFPEDPAAYADQDALMLGPDVLFSPVVEEGARTKTQYLPRTAQGWIEYRTGALHPGGATVTVDAPLGSPPVFIRVGAVLALASATPDVKPHDAPARQLYCAFAGPRGEGGGVHMEDDGESFAYRDGALLDIVFRAAWSGGVANVAIERRGGGDVPALGWQIAGPAGLPPVTLG